GSKMKPDRYQNDTYVGSKMILSLVSNRYPNNNNLNITNTTTNREKDAVVAVVNFKKLKEEGEEKMRVMEERLRDLDFGEKFIEQLLKDYSPRKIEEKLDLLMEKRNIQNPAGWLMAALKNDYQDAEQERYEEEPAGGSGNLVNTPEQVSREKALEAIRLIQDNLSACTSPLPPGKSSGVKENCKLKTEN
ncbi:MAG: hypothetical protein L6371_05610, partial [Candidatus Atribacteria bacterium]|nr:hypothetical protein [Candidatus Atribacteria bacterium]